MKLTFHGAARTTTGSKYILEANGRRVLLECGMYQGHRAESIRQNSQLPFDAAGLDAMLLSHAHIDHSGLIPVLCKSGFTKKIFCTDATADLCRVMLMDSAHIQEQDAAFLTRKNLRRGLPPVEPIYTQADAAASFDHFAPVAYHQPVSVVDGVTATWLDAGHILGSAMIVLDLDEGGKKARLVFTGDLGRGHSDILRDPEHPGDADYLMIESTYGDRTHEPLADVDDRVCAILNRALERNGKIIIPAFSVGRTQQLLYTLYRLAKTRCIPTIPTYVDSPLSLQATEVFRRHPECFNKSFYDVMMNRDNPFSMGNITYIQSVEESIALNDLQKPCIIISASGMAEAGRIRHHLKNNIEDPRTTVLIVGYCAAHTLGAQLVSGQKKVNILGDAFRVRATIESIDAFSGHADREELGRWVGGLTGPLRGIFVVHGDEEPSTAFAAEMRRLHPQSQVIAPQAGEFVELQK